MTIHRFSSHEQAAGAAAQHVSLQVSPSQVVYLGSNVHSSNVSPARQAAPRQHHKMQSSRTRFVWKSFSPFAAELHCYTLDSALIAGCWKQLVTSCRSKHQPSSRTQYLCYQTSTITSVLPSHSCHACTGSNDLFNAHYSPPPLAGQMHHSAKL
jgi:hypothetical protein